MTYTQKVVSFVTFALIAAMSLPLMVSAQGLRPAPDVSGGQNPQLPGAAPVVTPEALGVQYGEYTGLGKEDVRITIARIINVALGLLGIIAVVIILIGGFQWMTSGGSEEGAESGKKTITAGVIGLAIILSAYAIARFVLGSLTAATVGSGI